MSKQYRSYHVFAINAARIATVGLCAASMFGYFDPPHRIIPLVLFAVLMFVNHTVLRNALSFAATIYFEFAQASLQASLVGTAYFRSVAIISVLLFTHALYSSYVLKKRYKQESRQQPSGSGDSS